MNRFPDFPTNLLFAETAPAEAAKAEAPTGAAGAHEENLTATTEQPVPLAPQHTGVLRPISGGQTLILVLFGVLAFCMLLGMTRYGSKNNYGD